MQILGIETSCDETAVSVCEYRDSMVNMLSNTIVSQIDIHRAYGGVVPEIAARSHIEAIIPTIDESIKTAFGNDNMPKAWAEIDAIAVTYGAGLGGALLIGTQTAKTLAVVKNKPLYAANHVLGHVYANFITSTTIANEALGLQLPPKYILPERAPEFPLLALIVSGKHSQLVLFRGHFDYTVLGKTYDDAIGEAFDKVAKMTGLRYPGGPSVAAAAILGDPNAFVLPTPRMEDPYDSSFSGLKTAVLRKAQMLCGRDHTTPSFELPSLLKESQVNDIAAVFQKTAVKSLVDKMARAYDEFAPKDVVIAGGVAASTELRRQLSAALPIEPLYTDTRLCTDNGAMIATLGLFMALEGQSPADPYSLDIAPSLKM
jgi:N6-L-threonylcarbamoyladenine synthase